MVSPQHDAYLAYADSCASVPFEQDYLAVLKMKESGRLPSDAVLVNGNSGDFISGNHIPPALHEPAHGLSSLVRRKRVLKVLVAKHFSLWECLKTPKNLATIHARLAAEMELAGVPFGDPEQDHGAYEFCEFQDRQTTYVTTGQRIYEFLGLEWRLPLWDNEHLQFWESVPLVFKVNQRLYREMLESENWGGVWRSVPVNARNIRPRWVAPLRHAFRLALAPFGRTTWHEWEKRLFDYPTEILCLYALWPYWRIATDKRGARNIVSWLCERYLNTKDLSLDHLEKEK